MIQSDLASLVVWSTETDPDEVSRVLGVEPNDVWRKGEARWSGRVHEHHIWSLDADMLDATEDDRTGTCSLRALLEACAPAAGRIATLPADCETRIWWSAYSDSIQGGFVLPIELAVQIAALGVDLYGTAYLDTETEEGDA